MTFGYSQCNLIGRLVKDPIYLDEDSADKRRVTFCLAVNNKRRDRDDVMFINCVGFKKISELFQVLSIKKGDPLFIEGEINISGYEKDGEKKETFSIVLKEFTLLRTKEKTKVA
jgi:single-stranded DNA-binding protein